MEFGKTFKRGFVSQKIDSPYVVCVRSRVIRVLVLELEAR